MKTFKNVCAQGEVNARRIESLPDELVPVLAENSFLIVGHSESGHHHGFKDDGDVQVMEKTKDIPSGMKILYAIVKNPSCLIQDTNSPHETIVFEPGLYEFRISREYNPFAEEARRVKD